MRSLKLFRKLKCNFWPRMRQRRKHRVWCKWTRGKGCGNEWEEMRERERVEYSRAMYLPWRSVCVCVCGRIVNLLYIPSFAFGGRREWGVVHGRAASQSWSLSQRQNDEPLRERWRFSAREESVDRQWRGSKLPYLSGCSLLDAPRQGSQEKKNAEKERENIFEYFFYYFGYNFPLARIFVKCPAYKRVGRWFFFFSSFRAFTSVLIGWQNFRVSNSRRQIKKKRKVKRWPIRVRSPPTVLSARMTLPPLGYRARGIPLFAAYATITTGNHVYSLAFTPSAPVVYADRIWTAKFPVRYAREFPQELTVIFIPFQRTPLHPLEKKRMFIFFIHAICIQFSLHYFSYSKFSKNLSVFSILQRIDDIKNKKKNSS